MTTARLLTRDTSNVNDYLLVFIELVTILFLFSVSVFWPWSVWDLSSPTRDSHPLHWKVPACLAGSDSL